MSHIYYLDQFTKEEIKNETSPLKAIKHYCRYACCVGDTDSWRYCKNEDCFLHKFRLGKRGKRTNPLNEEQKSLLIERIDKARKSKKNHTKI